MLRTKHDAERIVAADTTCIVVRTEHTRIARTIAVIASTNEERIARVHEVSVVQFNPKFILIFLFASFI